MSKPPSVAQLMTEVNAALAPASAEVEIAAEGSELFVAFMYARQPDAEALVKWFLAEFSDRHHLSEFRRIVFEGRFKSDADYHWRTSVEYPTSTQEFAFKLPKPLPRRAFSLSRLAFAATITATFFGVGKLSYYAVVNKTELKAWRDEAATALTLFFALEDEEAHRYSKTPPKIAPRVAQAKPKKDYWVDPQSVGEPYGQRVAGVLTFRGNPTRSYYGKGPVPKDPSVLWRYPEKPMCANSTDRGQTFLWCGTGWTGQPAVFEREGKTWVVFGAFDRNVHFVDALAGRAIMPPFRTGDIIKGSVTIDPDGYPIVYTGSRDGYFRGIAFDRSKPRELWRLAARSVGPTMWNDDWDGSALVLDDHLFVGGENSRIHMLKLNRGYDASGRATLAPKLLFHAAGWDKELLRGVGDHNVSIENSVSISKNRVYFSNSGGLAQAWDIAGLKSGKAPTRVFRYWTGDDTDASIVVDKAGALYVASEWERMTKTARRVGQLVKLDPSKDDPLVWSSWSLPKKSGSKSGLWATPALFEDIVIAASHDGVISAVDAEDGKPRWTMKLRGKTWQSPVVVDGVLIQGDCSGDLSAYDIRDTHKDPAKLWTVNLGGCIESTPVVWNGRVYVGSRAGFMYAIGDTLPERAH